MGRKWYLTEDMGCIALDQKIWSSQAIMRGKE